MAPHTRVLIVDADGSDATSLRHLLAAAGNETVLATDVALALDFLERAAVDVVLLALEVTGLHGVTLLAGAAPGVQIVALCGALPSGEGREALRLGAFDLVARGGDVDTLLFAVERATRAGLVMREVAVLRARVGERAAQALVGRSNGMVRVRELIGRAAASRTTVLVTGQPGTGKDVVARLVHDLSDRADRPYLTVRCAGADDATLQRELFGAPRSASGSARTGLFEEARGGTLVLDEVTGISPVLRVRLAQVLADRAVRRDGDAALVPIDVRLIFTSREELEHSPMFTGADGLHGRIAALPIALPPLRERRSDVPLLVKHFVARIAQESGREPATLTPDEMVSLLGQPWPGNVRELEHFVERLAYQPAGTAGGAGHGHPLGVSFDDGLTMEDLERRYILHVLDQEQGHQSRAADRLGIDRRTLYRKLRQLRDAELPTAVRS
ncbi:MAG: sigma-54-dependent Fis family transcriptional regulator [Gemmatimonadetes bacterium]|jgi:DNA-binding NtrC family response regulator|nr:sigma-54-dependent Fis family transcriptional regulator [Gemmatimonadota bacterium]